ncbi:hypothetical protein EYI23_02870 [Bacillus subtilis]|nr:hypothetical protein [Bacillus subtilis]
MKKLEKCYEYTIQCFSKHIDKLSELIDDARFELTVDEPDVEAMHDELYFDYLAEMDEKNN